MFGLVLAHVSSCVLREQVRNLLAGLTKEKGDAAISSAYSVYSSHWGSAPEQAVLKKTVADIETDFLFLVPTQTALQLHANHSRSALIGPRTTLRVSAVDGGGLMVEVTTEGR